MDKCINGFTYEQILRNFGSDDSMKVCKNCDNLVYDDGLMLCKIIKDEVDSK